MRTSSFDVICRDTYTMEKFREKIADRAMEDRSGSVCYKFMKPHEEHRISAKDKSCRSNRHAQVAMGGSC